jgi:cell division protein FtsB
MVRLHIVTKVAWSILGIVAVAMILSMFYPQYQEYLELQRDVGALETKISDEQGRMNLLRDYQERMKSDSDFVERVAREKLGYARPGEFVIKFVGDSRANVRASQ